MDNGTRSPFVAAPISQETAGEDTRNHPVASTPMATGQETTDDTASTNTDNKKIDGNTTADGSKTSIDFSICTFNCKGFKQSKDYIYELVKDNDVVCLNETWLWPAELSIIEQNSNFNVTVFSKSAMNDVIPGYIGRPFGGVSVICKDNALLNYRELESPSDRIITVGVYDLSDVLIQVICCVYMPYYKRGSIDQTEHFINATEVLQSVIDDYGALCPLKIFGDLNVQLPKNKILNRLWYKQPGFNPHCSIMYNFIDSNNLTVADFISEQSVNFTYFCDTRGVRTWIDHVLCFNHDHSIKSCTITPYISDNLSDHLPIITTLVLDVCTVRVSSTPMHEQQPVYVPASWSNHYCNDMYKTTLENKLKLISMLDLSTVTDQDELQYEIECYVHTINTAIHDSAKEAGCVSKKQFKPKPYWCPQLSLIRDKKRFWWSLWVDNGRPRVGLVFDC